MGVIVLVWLLNATLVCRPIVKDEREAAGIAKLYLRNKSIPNLSSITLRNSKTYEGDDFVRDRWELQLEITTAQRAMRNGVNETTLFRHPATVMVSDCGDVLRADYSLGN
jgi:hypothetical protein